MTDAAAPLVSIVTTCKGRLHHLRRSLPNFLAQPDTEVIVVDYDCPDETAGVCAREFPAVRVVKVENAPRFNWARARNLGAAAARGTWIAFFDADIVMAPDFVRRLGVALETAHRASHDAEAAGKALLALAPKMPERYAELLRVQTRTAATQDVELSWRSRR